jgi:Tfp pilus assembly protein PilW
MNALPSIRSRFAAFTLVEVLVGSAIASAMFAAALYAGVGALKSLYAADDYSKESNEQLRAMDFIARDIRGALTVTVPVGGQTLMLTLPEYSSAYDAQGNPTGSPVNPALAANAATYGNATQPILVTYSVNGGSLIREQVIQSTGSTSRLVVAENVSALEHAFVPQSTTVKYSISFQPRQRGASAALRAATTLTGTVASRPMRLK